MLHSAIPVTVRVFMSQPSDARNLCLSVMTTNRRHVATQALETLSSSADHQTLALELKDLGKEIATPSNVRSTMEIMNKTKFSELFATSVLRRHRTRQKQWKRGHSNLKTVALNIVKESVDHRKKKKKTELTAPWLLENIDRI